MKNNSLHEMTSLKGDMNVNKWYTCNLNIYQEIHSIKTQINIYIIVYQLAFVQNA